MVSASRTKNIETFLRAGDGRRLLKLVHADGILHRQYALAWNGKVPELIVGPYRQEEEIGERN
jgi:hypothetical protein